ncbi:MgtC/SapB family protein [Ferrimicrobium sp.]|uniref:MgtC/SapB family protein n=1 Tax=Ferrimicrobium sp. TaxID=2926050 RepID=UPI0026350FCC|nr:MgtC/SapB family protein [Ferrimicrobium sp.]
MKSLVISLPLATALVFLGRAAGAFLLGALIGSERQWRSRMAGLRTNALVALGAATFEMLAIMLASGPIAAHEPGVDYTRVTAYIVSGVGFLGAGVIIRDGVNLRGINTAATIWCSAAVGALAGNGYLIEAIVGALLVLAVHLGLRPIAHLIDRTPADENSEIETIYQFEAICRASEEGNVRLQLTRAATIGQFRLRSLSSQDQNGGAGLVKVEAELIGFGRNDIGIEEAVSRLSLEPSITSVAWKVLGLDEGSVRE